SSGKGRASCLTDLGRECARSWTPIQPAGAEPITNRERRSRFVETGVCMPRLSGYGAFVFDAVTRRLLRLVKGRQWRDAPADWSRHFTVRVAEFTKVRPAFMRRQEIHEALVVAVRDSEQLQQRPVIAAACGQSAANQFADVM